MEYAYRIRDALVELAPGEVGIWRLPPMTRGVINIKTYYAMPPGWSSGGGGSARSTRVNPLGAARDAAAVELGAAIDIGGGSGAGTIARDSRPWQPGGLGPDLEIGDIGGSFGETMELTLELLQVGTPVAIGLNHIFHETPNAGDIWALKVTRKVDGSVDRRRYRIHVQYPSVLPLETRRVPTGFLNRGFDANWNDNPYLAWFQLRDNVLSYQWNVDFAALYGLPTDNQHIPLGTDRLKLPTINSINLSLAAGGGPDPMPAIIEGEVKRDMPFFALHIDCTYEGSRNVEIDVPGPNPTITLPDPLWIIARFYLAPGNGGALTYYTEVESPLLEMLNFDISYPSLSQGTETINVRKVIKDSLENWLYQLQFGGHVMDSLRRWIVGRYEVVGTAYDHNTQEMVFTYVGRQRPPARVPSHLADVVADELMATARARAPKQPQSQPEWPRLFDTPFEMPLEAPPGVGTGPRPAGHDAGALNKIDHIVVLIQENRSFDQILGYLSRDGMAARTALLSRTPTAPREARSDHVDGLLPDPNDRDAIRFPDQPGGPLYRSQRTFTTGWPSFALDNPCHGHACVERQIADDMKGFVADYARKPGMGAAQYQLIMNYMTDIELPAFGALTREFAICDKWFCSHIGGTLPNRFINLTGDLSEDVYGSPEVENPDLFGSFAPLEATTFLDHLSARNVSWTLFEHNYCTLRMFRKYTFDESHIVGFNDPDRGFAAMARAGKLPSVSFIEPDYIEAPGGNDDHAPADMINGQVLVAKIVSALLENPEQWAKTLLIITYDEHGGFYDHVPLPFEITTESGGTTTTLNIAPLSNGERRLGVRVPAFVVSPLIEAMPGGKVNASHTVFDHTSITATILRRFCASFLPDMGPRVNEAADVRHLLTLDVARPATDFAALGEEMRAIAQWPTVALAGVPPTARRKPDAQLEDFHALVAYATSVTGKGRQ